MNYYSHKLPMQEVSDGEPKVDLSLIREKLGHAWGLGRAVTKVELARALKLSPKNGGDYLSRLEKDGKLSNGPLIVALEAFLAGYAPNNLQDLITPGYPRGPVR